MDEDVLQEKLECQQDFEAMYCETMCMDAGCRYIKICPVYLRHKRMQDAMRF
jgi:hypothetical protein